MVSIATCSQTGQVILALVICTPVKKPPNFARRHPISVRLLEVTFDRQNLRGAPHRLNPVSFNVECRMRPWQGYPKPDKREQRIRKPIHPTQVFLSSSI